MKKHPILLRLIVLVILIAAVWLEPMFSEWVWRGVILKKYPEDVKWELRKFRFHCAPYPRLTESWISRVDEEDLPRSIQEWIPEYVVFHDAAGTNKHGMKFDFNASTPYFFKCQHDQYLLIWRTNHPPSRTNESMIVCMDEMNIWQDHMSIRYPVPENAGE